MEGKCCGSLYSTVWCHPRATMQRIVEKDSWGTFWCVLGTYFIIVLIDNFSRQYVLHAKQAIAAMTPVAWVTPVITTVMFTIMMMFGWWIGGAFLKLTGSWLGGHGRYRNLCTALALGAVPYLEVLLVVVIVEAIFHALHLPWLGLVYKLVLFVATIYTIVVACKAIAVAQGFESAWRGFGNWLLNLLCMIILGGIIVLGLTLAAPHLANKLEHKKVTTHQANINQLTASPATNNSATSAYRQMTLEKQKEQKPEPEKK